MWPDHPEKVLGTTRAFVDAYPNTRPRAGHGGPRRQPLHRTERREPPGHRATDQRPRPCRRSARRDPAALLRPLPGRPRQRLAGPASAAFLCRRRSQPALALGWHVVHDPIPPLGPRCAKTRTTWASPAGSSRPRCTAMPRRPLACAWTAPTCAARH
ncbi:hypothetical protein ACPA9J_15485 [Pseudomonas aeruginosa]